MLLTLEIEEASYHPKASNPGRLTILRKELGVDFFPGRCTLVSWYSKLR